MNIAIVVYSPYSSDARVRRYTEALARMGYKIDCIALAEKFKPKEKNINLIKYLLPRKRLGRLWYIIEYLLFFLYTTWVLTKNHILKHYKFIHINNMPDILVFTAVIPRLLGAKILLDMHDPMPELYMSKYHVGEESLMVKGLKWLEKISFAFADKIITANEAFKSLFLKRLNLQRGSTSQGDKISVILNCPDPRIFHSQPFDFAQGKPTTHNLQQFTLFYMGTVEERFGLDIVLDATAEIVKQIPDFKFIVVPKLTNEGEYFQSFRNRIYNSELSKYVVIESPKTLEEIAEMLKQADVGIVLAKNGAFTENIFPVKLLEFVQMNIPIIATKTKVLSQYFNINQIYFLKKNTPGEFAKAVIDLYKDKKLRQNLSKNAKLYLKEYNWMKEEKKYLDIIDSLTKPI